MEQMRGSLSFDEPPNEQHHTLSARGGVPVKAVEVDTNVVHHHALTREALCEEAAPNEVGYSDEERRRSFERFVAQVVEMVSSEGAASVVVAGGRIVSVEGHHEG